jgi:c-di-GMP-binding flagellar brake protein YcgR
MQPSPNQKEPAVRPETPLRINDRLQVIVLGTDEEVPTTYLSRVEDFADGAALIGWPTHAGIRAPLRENDRLSLTYVEEGGVYHLTGRVVQRVFEPLPLIRVLPDGQLERVQRREYVRVPAMLEVRLFSRVVTAATGDEEASVNLISTRTVNISGGGILIHHSAPPRPGSIYETKLWLPGDTEPLNITAKVVRSESVLDPVRGTYYAVGFAFLQIPEGVRRRIVNFVFRYQQSSLQQ